MLKYKINNIRQFLKKCFINNYLHFSPFLFINANIYSNLLLMKKYNFAKCYLTLIFLFLGYLLNINYFTFFAFITFILHVSWSEFLFYFFKNILLGISLPKALCLRSKLFKEKLSLFQFQIQLFFMFCSFVSEFVHFSYLSFWMIFVIYYF